MPHAKSYDSDSVRKFPCGGTEKATIFLGEAFQQLGHQVEWITTIQDLEAFVLAHDFAYDAVITQEAEFLTLFGDDTKKVFWSHHYNCQPITRRSAPFSRCFADKIVTLSQHHHDDLLDSLKIESTIIGHGVWLSEVCKSVKKDRFRLMYASTPFRGLSRIPELFREIKAKEPEAGITICSSMATYGQAEKDSEYTPIFEELIEMEGVTVLRALPQQELYDQYAKASIFLYPSIWRETYCLALDEALAHGCKAITSGLGALSERSYPYSTNDEILQAVDDHFQQRDKKVYEFTPKDWSEIAMQWQKEILE